MNDFILLNKIRALNIYTEQYIFASFPKKDLALKIRLEENLYLLVELTIKANVNKGNIRSKYQSDLIATIYLVDYSSYIADSGFCNDRSLASNTKVKGKGYGKDPTYYASSDRLGINGIPQFSCPQKNDLFTVSNDKGNKALEYPIGLITADEVVYAGGRGTRNEGYYLYTRGVSCWTMTPSELNFNNFSTWGWEMSFDFGKISENELDIGAYIRPVINLSATVEVTNTNQDGTINNPYIVKTN